MVIKVSTKRATSIPNSTLRDKRLALDELGLLVRLLSRPAGWEIYPGALQKETGWGRDKLRKVLSSLESAGYLRRIKGRYQGDDPKKMGTWKWYSEIYDEAQEFPEDEPAAEEETAPCPENPSMVHHALKNRTTVGPSPVSPYDGEHGHIGFKPDLSDFGNHSNLTPPPKPGPNQDHGQVVGGGDGKLIPFPSQNQKPGIEDEYLRLALIFGQVREPGAFVAHKRKQWRQQGGLSEQDLLQLEYWRRLEAGVRGIDLSNCSNDTAAIAALAALKNTGD